MEQEQRWVFRVEIDRMTVGLFRFRIIRDWNRIVEGIYTLGPRDTDSGPYHDGLLLFWSNNNSGNFNRISTIEWEQLLTDKIFVEFDGDHTLSAQILAWLNSQFGIVVNAVKKNGLSHQPEESTTTARVS